MRVLITGGCGFIGHHVCEHLLKNTDWELIIFDSLTYASSGFNRLKDVEVFNDSRVNILSANFCQEISGGLAMEIGQVDIIIHIGAETHVDNSIKNPEPFIKTNVLGTMRLLEFAKEIRNLKLFVYFSTDEVFGPAKEGVFYREWDRYNSSNPYAASKAGGEELALAYSNTYNIPVLITHTMNVFGERQHPEKFIPLCINKILKDENIHIHSSPDKKTPGSRCWIHARDVAAALLFLVTQRDLGHKKINIVGQERSNLEIAQFIAFKLDKELKFDMVDFHSSRPGHDLRYALNGSLLLSMGFNFPKGLRKSLSKTIDWYIHPEHKHWLEKESFEPQLQGV